MAAQIVEAYQYERAYFDVFGRRPRGQLRCLNMQTRHTSRIGTAGAILAVRAGREVSETLRPSAPLACMKVDLGQMYPISRAMLPS